jgi:hypothetical protein
MVLPCRDRPRANRIFGAGASKPCAKQHPDLGANAAMGRARRARAVGERLAYRAPVRLRERLLKAGRRAADATATIKGFGLACGLSQLNAPDVSGPEGPWPPSNNV